MTMDNLKSGAYKDVDGNIFELISVAMYGDVPMCVYMDGDQMKVLPAEEWLEEVKVPRFRPVA